MVLPNAILVEDHTRMKRRTVLSSSKEKKHDISGNHLAPIVLPQYDNHERERRHKWRSVNQTTKYVFLFVLVFGVGVTLVRFSKDLLLGHHSIRGGLLGPFIDGRGRAYITSKTEAKNRNALGGDGTTPGEPSDLFEPSFVSANVDSHIQVTVKEIGGMSKPTFIQKQRLQRKMIEKGCEPSFLCNRCLRFAGLGNFYQCDWVCSKCYKDILCHRSPKKILRMNVIVNDSPIEDNASLLNRKLIPRIIHQTWFEELSAERYPELIRLQNSWKLNGWDYRFYTDKDARNFIVKNYPSRFLLAYDGLIPGAFKADFFRYLVLLISGGVYADIDVMLDTSLETFIRPDMGFFAPRDTPGYVKEEYFCLWNGFIGSAPGHPFLVKAVERTLNLILDRADQFDVESYACQNSQIELEWWKVRSEAGLFLSGPCALGVAVNSVLGSDPFAHLDLGWINSGTISNETLGNEIQNNARGIFGNSLILQQKKNDLGAHRFTDPVRNVIVASTDNPGVSKIPVANVDHLNKKQTMHYSKGMNGDHIWGSMFVYVDEMVTNETIILDVITK